MLHQAGAFTKDVWRVDSGALRLDLVGDDGDRFVQLALAGDHLGVESHCGLPTLYRATAVTRCVLGRVSVGNPHAQRVVIHGALVQQWCRAADQIALRTGSAGERVRQLLLLLASAAGVEADGSSAVELPRLTDIAAIVDTAPETVSRILSHWRRQALLQDAGATTARFDCRRLAACDISQGMTCSAHRDAPAPRRGALTPKGRP